MKKLSLLVICILLFNVFPFSSSTFANNIIVQKCNYTPQTGVNPDYQVTNCLLTETAMKHNIPPEVLKAVAEVESGGWKQFNHDGSPIITFDGGIGIMQITLIQGYDEEKLKNDILYNINAGAEILVQMFNRGDLPKIHNHDRRSIESWYFAVMAYNGIKPVNSPIVQATNTRNVNAYQEKVFDVIEKRNLLKLTRIPFSSSDFQYSTTSSENIVFLKRQYSISELLTASKHFFEPQNRAYISSNQVALRSTPSINGDILQRLELGTQVSIIDRFQYEQNKQSQPNHFVWYPVKLSNGTEGFVASSYLTNTAPSQATPERKTIVLAINNRTVSSNGVSSQLLAAPFISNQRTLVPLRFISENLGANVDWQQQTKRIIVNMGGKTLILHEGNRNVTVNSSNGATNYTLEAAPIIRNGTTFIPIRFVSEQLGGTVNWDAKTQTVTIIN